MVDGNPGAVRPAREALVAFAINMAFSAAFFLGVFGTEKAQIGWCAPDGLAFDFLPQSIAVALMSATVPVFVLRTRRGQAGLAVPAIGRIVSSALALAACAGGVGYGAFLLAVQTCGAVGWTTALALKLAYGGCLGAGVATLAVGRAFPSDAG